MCIPSIITAFIIHFRVVVVAAQSLSLAASPPPIMPLQLALVLLLQLACLVNLFLDPLDSHLVSMGQTGVVCHVLGQLHSFDPPLLLRFLLLPFLHEQILLLIDDIVSLLYYYSLAFAEALLGLSNRLVIVPPFLLRRIRLDELAFPAPRRFQR